MLSKLVARVRRTAASAATMIGASTATGAMARCGVAASATAGR